jgi:hypothetical protein
MLFDAADPTAIADHRIDSTVAPQALFLMNDPFVAAKAAALAERVSREGGSDDRSRIQWVYRVCFSRKPTDDELEIGKEMLVQAGWAKFCQVLLCTNEFVYVD